MFPQLTEERRRDLIKVAAAKAEDARISIRNIRRHAKDALDKLQKDGEAGEDDVRRAEKELEETTHALRRARSTRCSGPRKPSCSRSSEQVSGQLADVRMPMPDAGLPGQLGRAEAAIEAAVEHVLGALEQVPSPPEGAPGTRGPGRAGATCRSPSPSASALAAIVLVPLFPYRSASSWSSPSPAASGLYELTGALATVRRRIPLVPLAVGAVVMLWQAWHRGRRRHGGRASC